MLQCLVRAAVCCSVAQCTAVCCNVCCSVLRHSFDLMQRAMIHGVAVCCSVFYALQCVVMRCSMAQCIAVCVAVFGGIRAISCSMQRNSCVA